MRNKFRLILIAVLAVIFVVSTTMFISQLIDKERSKEIYDKALDIALGTDEAGAEEAIMPQTTWVPAPIEEEDAEVQKLEKLDLDRLREYNEDVVGWIRFPGIEAIDYPIMQGEDNTYYLDHAWDNSENYAGAIFMEHMNSSDFTDHNTIIYGHNMRNDTMFAALHWYGDPGMLQRCPYVYILTDEGVLRYEVFAAYYTSLDSPTYGLSFNQEETRVAFLDYAQENNELNVEFVPELTDRILTLSTCTQMSGDTRWVVQARLKMIEVPVDEAPAGEGQAQTE